MTETDNDYILQAAKSLSGELLSFCVSASLSEEGLREIIERHKLTPNCNLNVSNYDFFIAACRNESVEEGIIRCLLEYFPEATAASGHAYGLSSLHFACYNKNVTLGIVQLLINAAPDSVRSVNNNSQMPLHILCCNMGIDEKEAIKILKLLLKKCPESIRHADDKGYLPIHLAALKRSPEFCRVLIEAYPGSEQISSDKGELPFHFACAENILATVEYFYKLYPEAINHATNGLYLYPIHCAIKSLLIRNSPIAAVDIVRFLLDCDPNVKLQKCQGRSLLQYACGLNYNDSNMADLEMLKLLLEKCPESIRHASTSAGDSGYLPIHFAALLRSPECCRVLIEAYPGSERIVDSHGMLPLHLACRMNTLATVEYLYKLYPDAINHATTNGWYPIQLAILSPQRRNNLTPAVDVVRFLLDCGPNVKLQKLNGQSLLRILCDNKDVDEMAAIEMLKLLLEKCPESIRHTENEVNLPIHFAARARSPDFCRVLIEAYPGSERIRSGAGWLPLHLACIRGPLDTVEYFYNLYPDAINHQTNDDGWYPIRLAIHVAIRSPQRRNNLTSAVDVVRFLLDCDPNVKLQKMNGQSLLHILCCDDGTDEKAAIEILKLLLEKCPESIRHTDNEGRIPLHYAAKYRPPEFCRVLIEAYPGSERISDDIGCPPLHLACSHGTLDTVEYLYNLYPDAINHAVHEWYPIHLAFESMATRNRLDIVRFLLDSDPNVKLQKRNGKSLLRYACVLNYNASNMVDVEILKLLLEKCPESIRHAEDDGYLPIHCAALIRSPEFCRVLINAYPGSEQIADHDGFLPLHLACRMNTLATVEYFYNLYPDALNHATTNGIYPIHWAILSLSPQCRNSPTPAVDVVRFLLDCDPNVKLQKFQGKSLLHILCDNRNMNGKVAIEILKLLLEKCPESIRHTDNEGKLPLHDAAKYRSPEFCRMLIEAYPGSERISDDDGMLPLHLACWSNDPATVEYLYNSYPDAINHTVHGGCPILFAIGGLATRNSPTVAVNIVRFLLDCDPCVKLQKLGGASLLRFACRQEYHESNIDAALQIITTIYDVHPEAIEDDDVAHDTQHYHEQVREFINGELVHARQAKNRRQMTTRYGRLRLHRALQNNIRLGSIKLLVEGNSSAIRNSDNNGALPLHVACQHHDSPSVVQYLIGIDQTTLQCVDLDNDTALHYACRGAKYGTIALLLERYDAVSVSMQNVHQKLPIDLLWESADVGDRESVEYLDSVFRLMKAYPEMLMNIGMQLRLSASTRVMKRRFEYLSSLSLKAKSRKFVHE